MNRSTRTIAILIALLAFVSACGESTGATTTTTTTVAVTDDSMTDDSMADDMDMDHLEEFAFGDPMDASDASMVIEITASDDFTFDPPAITLSVGDVVTFRVTNTGAIPHDFTLGDADLQAEHDAEMAGMAGMADEPNAFSLAPGETKEVTWHITQAGELIYGCHQVGHYAAGMLGTITVEG